MSARSLRLEQVTTDRLHVDQYALRGDVWVFARRNYGEPGNRCQRAWEQGVAHFNGYVFCTVPHRKDECAKHDPCSEADRDDWLAAGPAYEPEPRRHEAPDGSPFSDPDSGPVEAPPGWRY